MRSKEQHCIVVCRTVCSTDHSMLADSKAPCPLTGILGLQPGPAMQLMPLLLFPRARQ